LVTFHAFALRRLRVTVAIPLRSPPVARLRLHVTLPYGCRSFLDFCGYRRVLPRGALTLLPPHLPRYAVLRLCVRSGTRYCVPRVWMRSHRDVGGRVATYRFALRYAPFVCFLFDSVGFCRFYTAARYVAARYHVDYTFNAPNRAYTFVVCRYAPFVLCLVYRVYRDSRVERLIGFVRCAYLPFPFADLFPAFTCSYWFSGLRITYNAFTLPFADYLQITTTDSPAICLDYTATRAPCVATAHVWFFTRCWIAFAAGCD